MTVRLAASLAVLTLTAACTAAAGGPGGMPAPVEGAAITYSTQPCFGTCPVYSVTVRPDGTGVFDGKNHTSATGTQQFAVDAATYRRFAGHLAAVKPVQGDRRIDMASPDCGVAPTDMPGISVSWSTGQALDLYLGCRSDEAMRVAGVLKSAPDLLPIAGYIGKPGSGKR